MSSFFNKYKTKFKVLVSLLEKSYYYLSRYKAINEAFIKNNVTKVKPLHFRRWHLGCAYFSGVINGKKVFIKIDTSLLLLKNEKFFYDIMNEVIPNQLLDLHFFYEVFNLQVICFSYAENATELTPELLITHPNYLSEAVFILKKIRTNSVIHRDIKLDNFIISNGKLKIIDFYFSCGLFGKHGSFKEVDRDVDDNLLILKRLGSKYKPSDFLWNDFVSLKNILNEIVNNHQLSIEQQSSMELIIRELDCLAKDSYYTLSN